MSKIESIKLKFISPVHFWRGREELDKTELIYHSDSLKSALYAVGFSLFDEWKNADYFFDNFQISSCFPYAGNELFLPKPQLKRKLKFSNANEDNASKKAKKIEFIEHTVFKKLVNSEKEEIAIDSNNISPDGAFICKSNSTFTLKDEKGNLTEFLFYKTEVQQRVNVPNEVEEIDSKPFYIDRIYFEKNCGLYFLAEFESEMIRSQVLQALKLLGENGIGTDRTVGNGQFDFNAITDVSDFNFGISGKTENHLLLGLYLPTIEEHQQIDFEKSHWSLLKRGGYMAGSSEEELMHLRKKSIYMFGEGSVLKSDKLLKGKFENLAPDWNNEKIHPVWRDGQCLLLKI